jgi:hypothetical protein
LNAGGYVRTDFISSSTDAFYGLVEHPDGKLVVAGGTIGDFAVTRYNTSLLDRLQIVLESIPVL